MKNTFKKITGLLTLSFLLSIGAYAQRSASPVIANTQKKQVNRIQKGIKSGSINRVEARQLKTQQINIQRTKRQVKQMVK